MSELNLKSWYLEYVAALEGRQLEKMDQFVAERVTLNGRPGRRSDVVADMRSILEPVPDMHRQVDELLLDRDRIVVRAINTGTPEKEWLGPPDRQVVPDRRVRHLPGRGRPFVEMTNLHDSADVRRQLTA